MKILVCPSGFKESLDPTDAANCIEKGIKKAVPDAVIKKVPLFDGGEGTARGFVAATQGQLRTVTVRGPVNEPIDSHFGFLGGDGPKTAVVEMAAAAGLSLVPSDLRDPTATTSYGVGELIRAALDHGAERILIGCGDSGTSDAGVGAIQALGARFLDRDGFSLEANAKNLQQVADIDLSDLHPRLHEVDIDVACNWSNVLCSEKGVARVYGPQKGASPEQVDYLANGLDAFAAVASRILDKNIGLLPGSGASGGLGAGLLLIGANLRPRYEVIYEYLGLQEMFADCQLVITAEGAIDSQTPHGKIPTEVSRRAKELNLPVVCLAGTVGDGADANYDAGIDSFTSILQSPCTLDHATQHAQKLLEKSAESTMRTIMIGEAMHSPPKEKLEVPLQKLKTEQLESNEQTSTPEAPRIIRSLSLKLKRQSASGPAGTKAGVTGLEHVACQSL